MGPSVVYAVAVNCLYKDRVSRVRVRVRDMDRVSGRVTDRVRVRVRVRRPDSSGNLLLWRKLHYAPIYVIVSYVGLYIFREFNISVKLPEILPRTWELLWIDGNMHTEYANFGKSFGPHGRTVSWLFSVHGLGLLVHLRHHILTINAIITYSW